MVFSLFLSHHLLLFILNYYIYLRAKHMSLFYIISLSLSLSRHIFTFSYNQILYKYRCNIVFASRYHGEDSIVFLAAAKVFPCTIVIVTKIVS